MGGKCLAMFSLKKIGTDLTMRSTPARVLELTDRKQQGMDKMLKSLPSDVSTPKSYPSLTKANSRSLKNWQSGWFEAAICPRLMAFASITPMGLDWCASNTTPVLVLRLKPKMKPRWTVSGISSKPNSP